MAKCYATLNKLRRLFVEKQLHWYLMVELISNALSGLRRSNDGVSVNL